MSGVWTHPNLSLTRIISYVKLFMSVAICHSFAFVLFNVAYLSHCVVFSFHNRGFLLFLFTLFSMYVSFSVFFITFDKQSRMFDIFDTRIFGVHVVDSKKNNECPFLSTSMGFMHALGFTCTCIGLHRARFLGSSCFKLASNDMRLYWIS